MKSIIWRRSFFILTLISSLLLGFWAATTTSLYMEFRRLMSLSKMDVMWVSAPRQLGTELYIAAEFLIAFAVPFGLTWLVYFIITRVVLPNSRIQVNKSKELV